MDMEPRPCAKLRCMIICTLSQTGYTMGSPDSFRPEPMREATTEPTIDAAYMDGVGLARFTSNGRVHVASYAAGLSFNARDFSYCACFHRATMREDLSSLGLVVSLAWFDSPSDINGNCMCHSGTELAPDWLGENYFCDAGIRGGAGCMKQHPFSTGCTSADECAAHNCTQYFANGRWYEYGQASPT